MSDVDFEILGGRYQLHGQVARGGMTDVLLGYDTLLSRVVAIKRLLPEFATDLSFVERFRREATAAANLNHPNIVEVYDWGSDAGTYYLVLEYIKGKSLAELISTKGPFAADRAVEIITHVAAALGFAHNNGVIHRDIKPGNVLLSVDGKVKVTDFGIAIAVLDAADSNLTKIGSVMGTATYFSPEQAQGKTLDRRSDLYSLGVVFYEMLCGRPPFTGDTSVVAAYKHVQEAVPTPASRGIMLPKSLEAINMKLLAKDPAQRYPTAEDLQQDLRRYRAEQNQRVLDTSTSSLASASVRPPDSGSPQSVASQQPHVSQSEPVLESSSTVGLFTVAVMAFVAIAVLLFFVLSNVLDNGNDNRPPVASTPLPVVEVPNVVGLTSQVATTELRGLGLLVRQVMEVSQSVPVGQIISQRPEATAELEVGGTVQIFISSGAPPIEVPGVVGEFANDATRFLQDRGLAVELMVDDDSTAPEGQVIRQDPSPGSEVSPGTSVILYVAGGPLAVEVPDVAGMTPVRATQVLSELGFVVSEELIKEFSAEVSDGLVVGTKPAPPVLLLPDTTIQLVISIGPESIEVPNLLGFTASVAVAILEELGFVLNETVTACNSNNVVPAPNALIQEQIPLAGEQHPLGTEVTVCVGIETIFLTPTQSPSNPDGATSPGSQPAVTQAMREARNAAARINAKAIAAGRQRGALGSVANWVALSNSFQTECVQLEVTFADIPGITTSWNLQSPYPMPASAATATNWVEGLDGDLAGVDDGCVVSWS
ncbi:MAG: Stk1 family PASTA domain-containing Ser/Thr kinase [Acidimicrobiia bacterium]|nr:Stk1 family PASTA domain-containing Ser/Thr kinase [Acidimicrobiia bacterium]MYC57575.1 Stk1 family PASTA domain-containing Ser/Thr kinase [Acidimicrobiia bacterium]MYG94865.1 Stk1 family PASTA domain-containing Ser/Thr kinase [Acidimicrobiia bacterium]MYI31294.1 Stk1 family PASTA domain-containing Ser/Thr kinase [Acidimicrobiia bacterium]